MNLSRHTILTVALCVLVARLAGVHAHLCAHDEGLQSELHTFTHEDVGCDEPSDSVPEPTDLDLDANDEGLVKTLKLKLGLDLLVAAPALLALDVHSRGDPLAQASYPLFVEQNRALPPPSRGPPA